MMRPPGRYSWLAHAHSTAFHPTWRRHSCLQGPGGTPDSSGRLFCGTHATGRDESRPSRQECPRHTQECRRHTQGVAPLRHTQECPLRHTQECPPLRHHASACANTRVPAPHAGVSRKCAGATAG